VPGREPIYTERLVDIYPNDDFGKIAPTFQNAFSGHFSRA
jgi:hypothetical protein